MATSGFRKGDIIRRNRLPGEIEALSQTRVHLRLLTDFTFRVYSSELVPLDKAPVLLRKRPKSFYTGTLVRNPDRLEKLCSDGVEDLLYLVLKEWKTALGKREFKQILLQDDRIVPEDGWNSFWTRAYKAMRADGRFDVDEHSRYFLVEAPPP